MSAATAYLAGPDVFLPNAKQHAARKVAICESFGIKGRPPLNEDIESLSKFSNDEAWQIIYRKDLIMMEECDIIIANLTPFAGASADAGTLVEVGWFLGRGKPIFGYSNSASAFEQRMASVALHPGIAVESFDLPDNLMIVGAVQGSGYPIIVPKDNIEREFEALDVFRNCVLAASQYLASAQKTQRNTAVR
jgi:nucleoside 2-deoxyribosyltransferase